MLVITFAINDYTNRCKRQGEGVLKNAEGFDQANRPDTVDRDWVEHLHRQYGLIPYWEDYH